MKIIETNLRFNQPLGYRSRTDFIVLHHADATNCTVWDVHQWHLNNGWAGIGYHYFITKAGEIYRGRPRDTIGSHCYGYNSRSVGICCEGNFEEEYMPAAQWRAVLELVRELKRIYPDACVVGHCELNSTSCPGRYFPLEDIKAGRGPVEVVKEVIWGMFKDVPNDHWAKNSIERLAQLGLLKGDEYGNFRPDEPVTRAQLAAVLERLLKFLGKLE
ncbi:N-acetylmuramoyl-L-alanine amidase [Desulfovirgula thermocuniculi]|uniref:N-acetylmuramoyl-L-alanine amidase n=1 Tax=Desulfovirgula thermocuniculi TaxID=348842 RepID=UPI000418746F|nr:N-acetylmuramoyl-L-alanine amidase [Desulfovirgula thermocuniculi]